MHLLKTLSYLVLCLVTFASAGFAQDAFLEFEARLEQQTQSIETVAEALAQEDPAPLLFDSMREVLRDRRSDLAVLREEILPLQEDAQAQIAALGPAPDPNAETPTDEAPNIIALRKELSEQALGYEGLMREIGLQEANAERLLDRIADLRRAAFIDGLFQPAPPLNDRSLWSNASTAFRGLMARLSEAYRAIDGGLKTLIAIIALLFLGGFSIGTLRSASGLHVTEDADWKARFEHLLGSLFRPILVLLGFFAISVLGVRLSTGEMPASDSLFLIALGLLGLILVYGLFFARAVRVGLMTRLSQIALSLIVILFALDAGLWAAGLNFGAQIELVVTQSYVSTVAVALIAFALGLKTWADPNEKIVAVWFKPYAYRFFFLLGALLLMINLFGYPALARFVLRVVVLISFVGLIALILRQTARKEIRDFLAMAKQVEESDPPAPSFAGFWLNFFLDAILLFTALPIVARIIGVDWTEIQDLGNRAFFGFQIGGFNISIMAIVLGIGLFLALILATRLIQRVLANRVLTHTRLTSSVRQSIVQIIGYIGLAIAFLIGVASIGFDLTNFALIAGALSVGIGFGLQSIVSNFVSGLILLFERPIKVGDWVATSAGEGFVRKISVRATEIETFDKNSIIVPNSELISNSVKNWTLNNNTGRVIVQVGASYDADPHVVKQILEDIGNNYPGALKYPPSSVAFRDFGASALIFDLRVFVRDILYVTDVANDLRLAIWDAFKEAGIEISYPQRDIRIRSAEGLDQIAAPNRSSKRK